MAEVGDWDVDDNDWGDVDVESLDNLAKPSFTSPEEDFRTIHGSVEEFSHPTSQEIQSNNKDEMSNLQVECLDAPRDEIREREEENSRLHEHVNLGDDSENTFHRVDVEKEDLPICMKDLEKQATVNLSTVSGKYSLSQISVDALIEELKRMKQCIGQCNTIHSDDQDNSISRFLELCDIFVRHCSLTVGRGDTSHDSSVLLEMVQRFSEEVKTKITATLSSPTREMMKEEEEKLDVSKIEHGGSFDLCGVLSAVNEVVLDESSSADTEVWSDLQKRVGDKLDGASGVVKDCVLQLIHTIERKLHKQHQDMALLHLLIDEKKQAMEAVLSLQAECSQVAHKLKVYEEERVYFVESLKALKLEKTALLKSLQPEYLSHGHANGQDATVNEISQRVDAFSPPSVDAELTDATLLDVESFRSFTSQVEIRAHSRADLHPHLPVSSSNQADIPNSSLEEFFPKNVYEKEVQLKDAMIDRLNTLIIELRGTEARLREGLECDYAELIHENEKLRTHTQQLERDLSEERRIVVQLSNRMQESSIFHIGVQTEDAASPPRNNRVKDDFSTASTLNIEEKSEEVSPKKRQEMKKAQAEMEAVVGVISDIKTPTGSLQMEQLVKENNELLMKHSEMLEITRQQKEEWHSLLSQLETVRHELIQTRDQSNVILAERDALAEELAKLHSTLNEFETLVTQLREQKTALETNLDVARKEVDELRIALENDSENECLQKKIFHLEHALAVVDEKYTAELAQAKLQYSVLLEERQREMELSENVSSILEIMRSCLDVSHEAVKNEPLNELKKLAISCRSQLEFYKQELEEEYTASDALRSELDSLRDQHAAARNDVAALKEELGHKTGQLEELRKLSEAEHIQQTSVSIENSLKDLRESISPVEARKAGWDTEDFDLNDGFTAEEQHVCQVPLMNSISSPTETGHGDCVERYDALLKKFHLLETQVCELENLVQDKESQNSTLKEDLRILQSRELDLMKDVNELQESLSHHLLRLEELETLHLSQREIIQRNAEYIYDLTQEVANKQKENELVQEQLHFYKTRETRTAESFLLSVERTPSPSISVSTQTEADLECTILVATEDSQDKKQSQARVEKLLKRVKVLQQKLQGSQQEMDLCRQRLQAALQDVMASPNMKNLVPRLNADADFIEKIIQFFHIITEVYVERVQPSVQLDYETLECMRVLADALKCDQSYTMAVLLSNLQRICGSFESMWDEDSLTSLRSLFCELSTWLSRYQEKSERHLETLHCENKKLANQLITSQAEENFLKDKLSKAEIQMSQLIEENDTLLEQCQLQQSELCQLSASLDAAKFTSLQPVRSGVGTNDFCGGTCSISDLVTASPDVKLLKKELKKVAHSHKTLEEHSTILEQILKEVFHFLADWSGFPQLPPQSPQATLDLLRKVKYLREIEKQQLQFDMDKLSGDLDLKDKQLQREVEIKKQLQVELNSLQEDVAEERLRHRTELREWAETVSLKKIKITELERSLEDALQENDNKISELHSVITSLECQSKRQQSHISTLESSLSHVTQDYENVQQQLKLYMQKAQERVDVGCDPVIFVNKSNKSVNTYSATEVVTSSFEYNLLLDQLRACEHKIVVTQKENAQLASLRSHDLDVLQELMDVIRKYWSFEFETLIPLPNFLDSCLGELHLKKEALLSEVAAFQKELQDSYNTIQELEDALHTQEDILKEKEDILSGNETEIIRLQRLADERDILLNELYERDPHHKISVSPVSVILLKEEINRLENEKWNLCSELAFHKERTSFLESQLDQWKRSDSLMMKLTDFEHALNDKVKLHKVDSNSHLHSPPYISANNYQSQSKEFKVLEQQLVYLKRQLEEQIGFRFQLSEVSKELTEKEGELFSAQTRIQELEGLLSRRKGLRHDIGTMTEDRPLKMHSGIQCAVGNDELALLNEKATRLEKQVTSLRHVEGYLEEEKCLHKRTKAKLERLSSTLRRLLRPPISAQEDNDLVSLVEFELQRLYQQSSQLEVIHIQKVTSLEQELRSLQHLMDESILERGSLSLALDGSRQEVEHVRRLYDQIREELDTKDKLVTQLQYIRKDLEEDLMLAKRQASTCSIAASKKVHQAVQVSMENAAVLKYELNCLREESHFSATNTREELQLAYLNIMKLEKQIKWYQRHFPNCSPPPSSALSVSLEPNDTQLVFGDAVAISTSSYIEEPDPQAPEEADSSLIVTASAVVDSLFEDVVFSVQEANQPQLLTSSIVLQNAHTSTTELARDEEYLTTTKEVDTLQDHILQLMEEKSSIKALLDESKNSSQVSVLELQSENCNLRHEIEILEEKLTQLTFSYEETQMALECFQHQSACDTLNSNTEAVATQRLEEYKTLCEDLQTAKDTIHVELQQMRTRICDLLQISLHDHGTSRMLQLVEEKVLEMKQKEDALIQELSSMKAAQSELTYQVAFLHSAKQALEVNMLASQREVEDLRSTNQSLTGSLESLKNEYFLLQQTSAQSYETNMLAVQQELENVKNSKQILTDSSESLRKEYLSLKQAAVLHVQSILNATTIVDEFSALHDALNMATQNHSDLRAQNQELVTRMEGYIAEIQWCQKTVSFWLNENLDEVPLCSFVQRLLNHLSEMSNQCKTVEEMSQKESLASQKKISVLRRTLHLFHEVLGSSKESPQLLETISHLVCDWEEAFEKDLSEEEYGSLFEGVRRLTQLSKLEEKAGQMEWYQQELQVLEDSHLTLQTSLEEMKRRNTSLEEERNCLLQQIDGHIKQLQAKQLEIVNLREQQTHPSTPELTITMPSHPLYATWRPSHEESDRCSISMASCASVREGADSPFHETPNLVHEHQLVTIRDLQERISQFNSIVSTAVKTTSLQTDIASLLPLLKDANRFLEEAEKERRVLIQKYGKCLMSLQRYKGRVKTLTRENAALQNAISPSDPLPATSLNEVTAAKKDQDLEIRKRCSTCEEVVKELHLKQEELHRVYSSLLQPVKYDVCQQTEESPMSATVHVHKDLQTEPLLQEEEVQSKLAETKQELHHLQSALDTKSRECEDLLHLLEKSSFEAKELNSRLNILQMEHEESLKKHAVNIADLEISVKCLQDEKTYYSNELDKGRRDFADLLSQINQMEEVEKVNQEKLFQEMEKGKFLESSNADLLHQVGEKLEEIHALNREKEIYVSKISELERECYEEKQQSSALGDEVKRLKEERSHLSSQVDTLNDNFLEERNRVAELQHRLQEVEGYLNVATQEVDRLGQLNAVHRQSEETVLQLQQELVSARETIHTIEKHGEQLKIQIVEKMSTIDNLRQEKEHLEGVLSKRAQEDLGGKIAELQQQCVFYSEEMERLKGNNFVIQEQLDDISHQFQEECNRTIELERQLQQLEEYYDMATQEIDNLRNHEAALIEELEIAKEAFERMEEEKITLQTLVKQYEQRASSLEENTSGEASASIASLNQQLHWLQVQLENTVNERSRIQQEFNRLSKAKNEVDAQLMRLSTERDLPRGVPELSQHMTPQQIPRAVSSVSSHSARDSDRASNILNQDLIEEQVSEIKNENAKLHVQVNILLTKCKKMEFKIRSLKKKNDNLVLKLEDKERELDESVDHIRKKLAIQERERTKWLREVANLKQQLQEKAEKIRCLEKHARGALNSDDLAHIYLSEVVQLREEVERLTEERETIRLSKEEEWKAIQGTVEELKSDNRQLQSKLRAATSLVASQQQEAGSSPLTSKSRSPAPDDGCSQCQQLAQMVQLLEDELQSRQEEKGGFNDWDDDWDFTSLANEQES